MYLLCIQKCFCLPNNCTVKDILILGDLTMEFKPLILPFKVVTLCRMYYGSVALLSHNILKWSEILGLSFLHGAGGPGNMCYGVQAHLVNFALHLALCQSKGTLP